jgi:predicted SnoaL-like aldol condensation-catalyzing enzyme
MAAMALLALVARAEQPGEAVARLEANKKLLLEFFRLGADREARMKMLADDYIQHNPRFLATDKITGKKGREAWGAAPVAAQGHARLTDPDFNLRTVPAILMAEGGYVTAIFKASISDPDNPAAEYEAFNFETVRIQDGKLVEHWDAVKLTRGWRTELEGLPGQNPGDPALTTQSLRPAIPIEATTPRSSATNSEPATLEANKKLFARFIDPHTDPGDRAEMLADGYIEHNPRFLAIETTTGKKGREAWLAAIGAVGDARRLMDSDFASSDAALAVLMAEGDYVCAILKAIRPDPDDPAKTYEAFTFQAARVKDGKLAEHWDGVKLAPGWNKTGQSFVQ